jgi:hypothetical protein
MKIGSIFFVSIIFNFGCQNSDKLTLIKNQLKEDVGIIYNKELMNSKCYENPEIKEIEPSLLNIFFKEKCLSNGQGISGEALTFKMNELIEGDLNGDGTLDYLVPYYLSSPPGNGYISKYAIYINNDVKYSHIGDFESGPSNSVSIKFSYIKDKKVFGKKYVDAFPLENENEEDVVFELYKSKLKQIDK